MSCSQLNAADYLGTVSTNIQFQASSGIKSELGDWELWSCEDTGGFEGSSSHFFDKRVSRPGSHCDFLIHSPDVSLTTQPSSRSTHSAQPALGPPTPRLPGCDTEGPVESQPPPDRLMKQSGLGGHNCTSDAIAAYNATERLHMPGGVENPSSAGHSADPMPQAGRRLSPPQASAKVGMDGEGRGFMHYHDEGGHGSGGWEEGDDGDSSGPGRLHASTVKRAGGTGMTEEELAALDPKRVRRIIANRQSAARSKERRLKYTRDLEQKVTQLQEEVVQLRRQLEQEKEDKQRAAVELQRQLSGQAYPYESGGRYQHEYRGMAYNQPSQPQPAGRPDEYMHVSQQLNANLAMLAQHSHVLQPQKRAPDIYPAAPKQYGLGSSGGVPGRALISPAQGHEEASSRSHSGGNSGGAWVGVGMMDDGHDAVRGHMGEVPVEVNSMRPQGPSSPPSPCTAQQPSLLRNASAPGDEMGFAAKLFPVYSPEMATVPSSFSMLNTSDILHPFEDMPGVGSDPRSLLQILKDRNRPHLGHASMLDPGAGGEPFTGVSIKQETAHHSSYPDATMSAGGPHLQARGMQAPWSAPNRTSPHPLESHPQMRVVTQKPSRLRCTRPVVARPQWPQDPGPHRDPHYANDPHECMRHERPFRDLGMPQGSAPAALRIQVAFPHGVDGHMSHGGMSHGGSPATRPMTPSGAWQVEGGSRGVFRTESLPVDFRIGSKYESASH